MTDAYEILGVSRTASDEDIKTAYRNLAKKYHPDNYADAPDIAEVASEKMREVNEAYDSIVKERKNGASSGNTSGGHSNAGYTNAGYTNAGSTNAGSGAYNNTYSTTTEFPDVRRLIMNNRFDDANVVLDGIPAERRNAEWNFLKGTVLYRRGWLEQAYTYLQTAVNMEPGNSEFRAAFNQAAKMRSGSSGGYRISGKEGGGCDPCNMCCGLLCADQCCECCGGDIISCC